MSKMQNETNSDRSRSRHRRPNKQDESFDSTDDVEDDPVVLERREKQVSKKAGPRLRECCRQSQAEVVSKSRNKVHQTWGPPF